MSDPHQTWKDADGDNTLALDWPINEDALVWEIGGFEGRWAAQMAEKFNPRLEIFEPQFWAAKKMQERFTDNPKVTIHYYGLWNENDALPLYNFETDGASLINHTGMSQMCDFWDIEEVLRDEPNDIDVGLMNIEGAEFVLLPYMFSLNLIERFRFFWCQFHPGLVKGSDVAIRFVYGALNKTHDLLWDYYPTAVAWGRKEPPPTPPAGGRV